MGAVDYISKPISPPVLHARVKSQLIVKESSDLLREKAEVLESEVNKRSQEMAALQDVTILAMASLAETRDTDNGKPHSSNSELCQGAG